MRRRPIRSSETPSTSIRRSRKRSRVRCLTSKLDAGHASSGAAWRYGTSIRRIKRGGGPVKAAPAPLEAEQRSSHFCDCSCPVAAVEHDEIRRLADGNAVIGSIHQLCRQRADHVEAGGKL